MGMTLPFDVAPLIPANIETNVAQLLAERAAFTNILKEQLVGA
jgi:hypothetical protein